MNRIIRTAVLLAVTTAATSVLAAGPATAHRPGAAQWQPAHAGHPGRHHAPRPPASTQPSPTTATATPPVGSTCDAPIGAATVIRSHTMQWTLADVQTYIGCAGVLVRQPGRPTLYAWDTVDGHVLYVDFRNGVVWSVDQH